MCVRFCIALKKETSLCVKQNRVCQNGYILFHSPFFTHYLLIFRSWGMLGSNRSVFSGIAY